MQTNLGPRKSHEKTMQNAYAAANAANGWARTTLSASSIPDIPQRKVEKSIPSCSRGEEVETRLGKCVGTCRSPDGRGTEPLIAPDWEGCRRFPHVKRALKFGVNRETLQVSFSRVLPAWAMN